MDAKGWLLYEPADARKNQWFIDKLISECALFGKELELRLTDAPGRITLPDLNKGENLPSFVINRTRSTGIARRFESLRIRVINPSQVTLIGNDKYLGYRFASDLDIPVMPYICIDLEGLEEGGTDLDRFKDTGISGQFPRFYERILTAASQFGYPLVIKPENGHGGKHVYLTENEAMLREALLAIGEDPESRYIKRILLQRPCALRGRDLRVYLVNGRVIAAMMRCASDKNEFRANFSLGGDAFLHTLTGKERTYTERIASALPSDMIGIDFIYDGEDEPVFNEIEDAVGSRMLYDKTDIDIISLFARHVCSPAG
ncbi:MAG: hypothetical protein K6F34_06860 [Lachnospiraceae bacterium]|nr:hypothetical protein [Lachnospiraceae bacterium]